MNRVRHPRHVSNGFRTVLPFLAFLVAFSIYCAYLQFGLHDALAKLFLVRIFFQVALAALVIAALKNVIGIPTLGTFAPAIVALAFLATGLPLGIALLGLILTIVLVTRVALIRSRVQGAHRVAILVSMVSFTISSIALLGLEFQQHELFFAVLFPVLITAWMGERYVEQVSRVGWEQPTGTLLWTLATILISFLVITQDSIVDFVMLNPLSWVALILLNWFLGTHIRLRLSERFRFWGIRRYSLGDQVTQGRLGIDVLTMSLRNREFVARYNPPSVMAHFAKDQAKSLLLLHGIPMPKTFLLIRENSDIGIFRDWLGGHDRFALKPGSGYGGEGIVLVNGERGGVYETNMGPMTTSDLEKHARAIVEGEFNAGQPDSAVVEELLQEHAALKTLAPLGLSDIRVVSFLGYPVMAMIRIPTKASGGKANLHLGAVAAGIRMSKGTTVHSVWRGFSEPYHPDTEELLIGREIPFWDEILEIASEAQHSSGLGFAGVDVAVDSKLGPVVMEVNRRPGLEIQNANAAGLLRRLRAIQDLPQVERPVEERVRLVRQLDTENWGVTHSKDTVPSSGDPSDGSGDDTSQPVPKRQNGSSAPRGVLPPSFYRGRLRAYKAIGLLVLIISGSTVMLAVSGRVDPFALLGPHVSRSEWAFSITGARALADRGLSGEGVNVCIVDSGIDMLHPDLARSRIIAWHDFVNFRPDPYDDGGHGTAMAGLMAADGSIRGAAPHANLIIVKVTNATGEGTSQSVADGIRFCVDPWGDGRHGADIVSVSLGSKGHLFVENKVSDAATWATNRGVFVVAAAGNDGLLDDGDVEIPANVPEAIAVGAVDSDGTRASFSSIGSSLNRSDPDLKPELVAPGVRLISTAPGARFVTITGTSAATALVAGILALFLEAKPYLKPGGQAGNIGIVKNALESGAHHVQGQVLPHDPWYGYGMVYGPGAVDAI